MIKKIAITFIAILSLASCHKNDSPVGVDILPNTDQLGGAYAEILPTLSYTKFEDSTRTSNITSSNLLGSINDPVFGRTDVSIYSNFELPYVPSGTTALGTNPVLDSAVLCLIYNTSVAFMGDTTHPLTIDVFPLTQRIYRDSVYYSGRNIPYNKNYSMIEGGQSKTFYPNLYTKFKVNKDDPAPSAYPQLRLRLRKEFGEMLFNYTYLSSYSNLQNAFNGFFISTNRSVMAQPSYGSIFYIDMNLSSIKLYYHNDAGPQQSLPLICGANSVRFGHYDHDYKFLAEQHLAGQLYSPYDTVNLGKQNIYLQGLAGLKAKIEFPDLLKWTDSNIVINKAELVLKTDNSQADYSNTTLFHRPARLYLEGENPFTGLPSTLIENVYAFGGIYNATTQQYAFEIPHTLAQIFTKKITNTTFYTSVFTGGLFGQRVVIGGSGNTGYPIKLKLWYTRLNFPKGGKQAQPHHLKK